MVKKVITNLDSLKASSPDCIPVVVLKNCEPEFSYILAKLFNNCLKESCFPDCWKVSSVVPVFKNVGERSTLYSKCDQTSDLWQQLELASELESDLRDTVDWGRKWLVDFNAGKTRLVSFDRSKNTGAIDVKMDGSVLEEKTSFKMLGLTFSSTLDWALTLFLLLKLPPRKLEP